MTADCCCYRCCCCAMPPLRTTTLPLLLRQHLAAATNTSSSLPMPTPPCSAISEAHAVDVTAEARKTRTCHSTFEGLGCISCLNSREKRRLDSRHISSKSLHLPIRFPEQELTLRDVTCLLHLLSSVYVLHSPNPKGLNIRSRCEALSSVELAHGEPETSRPAVGNSALLLRGHLSSLMFQRLQKRAGWLELSTSRTLRNAAF